MAYKSNSQKSREYVRDLTARKSSKKKSTKENEPLNSRSYSNSERSKRYQMGMKFRFDTLGNDVASLSSSLSNVYSSWQTPETMKNTRASVESVYNRLLGYQDYQKKYGDGSIDLTDLIGTYKYAIDNWDDLAYTYSGYKDADAWKKASEKSEAMKTADLGVIQKEIADLEGIYSAAREYSGKANSVTQRARNFQNRSGGAKSAGGFADEIRGAEKEYNDYLASVGYGSLEEIEKALGEKKVFYTNASRMQNLINMSSVGDINSENYDKDYNKYVESGKSIPADEVGTSRRMNPQGKGRFSNTPTVNSDLREAVLAGERRKNGETSSNAGSYHDKGAIFDEMTDEELNNLYYYIGKDAEDGGNRAEEYVNVIKDGLNSRRSKDIAKMVEETPLGELGFSLEAGLDQWASGVRANFSDEDYIPYSPIQQASGRVRHNISEEYGSFAAGAYDFGVTGANMLPSILSGLAISAVAPQVGVPETARKVVKGLSTLASNASMFAGARGNAYQEMLNLGYSKEQASTYGNLVGASEVGLNALLGGISKLGTSVTSKSITKLVSSIDNGLARFAIRYPLNMASEGIEEGLQEVLTPTFKNIAAGYDTGEKVDWGNVAYSALLGGLLGGVFEAAPLATEVSRETRFNNAMGKNIKANERVGDLLNFANNPEMGEAYETYTQYANKGINADNISDYKLGNLYSQTRAGAEGIANSKKSTAEQKAQAEGIIKELDVYAQASPSARTGSATNFKKSAVKEAYDKESTVSMIADGLESAEGTESHKLAVEYMQKLGLTEADVTDIQNKILSGESLTLEQKAKIEGAKSLSVDEITKLSDANDAAIRAEENASAVEELVERGESKDVAELVARKIRGEILTTEEASKVAESDVALQYVAEQSNAENVTEELLEMAKTMPKKDAALFVALYDGKTDMEAYANAFNLAVMKSEKNFSQDDILKSKSVLSNTQVSKIFEEVRVKADKEVKVRFDNLIKATADKKFYKGSINESVIDYDNKSTEGKVNWKDLDSRQRQAITFMNGFARATGINLVWTKDDEKANGKYDRASNTLYLDVYAGIDHADKLADTIIPTASHELTHWMEKKSPEFFRKINNLVFSTLYEHDGRTEEKRIKDEMARTGKSEDVVRSEIIARACEEVLSKSEQGKKIFNSLSKSEQKTFVDKIKEIIQDIADWVSEVLGLYGKDSLHYEARVLHQYQDKLNELVKLWDEALVGAVEVNQALEKSGEFGHKKSTSEGEVLEQARELQAKDPTKLTEDDFKNLLGFAEKKILKDDTYIPARINTPQILIAFAKEQGKTLENHPLAMRVYKARQALANEAEWDGNFRDKPHDLTIEEVVDIVKAMNTPSYLVYQTENDRFAEIVKFDKEGEKEKAYAIIDFFDIEKNPDIMNGYKGGKYNILVTIYPSEDSSELKDYLGKKSHIVMTSEEIKKKGLSQGSYGSLVPSLLNDSPFFDDSISETNGEVNAKNSKTDSSGRELSEGQKEYFKDSKVRGENGSLLVMYRGDSSDFTVFDRKKSRSSNLYGRGFYFTNSKAHAEQYGNSREFYLNIKNPLSPNQNVITENQMLAFLQAIENDGEDYDLYNYGEGSTAESVLNMIWGKGDFEMLQDVSASAIGDLVAAVNLFNEVNGTNYDGFILPTETVTFNSNQAKLTSNLNPTENDDILFSMKESVEETRDLVAVHNMRVSELERTLDLGGLPMPSIAIIKAKSGHSEYGDVSLVFPKSTIDPKANGNNKVYGGDAWTPTYPTIEYKPNEKVSNRISDKYHELSRKFGYDESRPFYKYVYEMEDILNRHKGEEEMLAELYEDEGMMQVYLLDTGKNKIETIQKEVSTELTDAEVEMNEFFIHELGADVVDAIVWDGNGTPMSYRKEYLSKYENSIREAYKKLLSEEYHFTDEQVQNVMDSTKNSDLIKFMRDAHKYRKNGRVTTRTESDYEATQKAIKEAAGEDYRKWIDSIFKGIEEKSGIRNNTDTFTNSGNRRSWEALHWENNLENVVKVMKSQDNGQTFFGGQAIWAVSAKDYSSVSDIKADSDRLMTMDKEQYEAIKEAFGDRFNEIAVSMMDKSESNYFIALDNAMECVVDALRHSKTKSGIMNYLKQFKNLTVTETNVNDIVSLATDISNMPTEYFEAKPKRAVELNEIATAIIPDNTSEVTKARLNDMGIKYVEYESGNENARLDALNSLEDDVLFSERDSYMLFSRSEEVDSDGRNLSIEQAEFFKDSKARNAKGNLLVMWHGTNVRRKFYKFNTTNNVAWFTSAPGYANAFTHGDGKKVVYKVYLNITNPLYLGNIDGVADEASIEYLSALSKIDASELKRILTEEKGEHIWKITNSAKFKELVKNQGYDGYIAREGGVSSWAVFDSAQAKEVDNDYPSTDKDIRYSERDDVSIYDLMGENERIKKQNEEFKAELERYKERLAIEKRVTNNTYIDNNKALIAAGHIRNIANSNYDKIKLAKAIQGIYSYIMEADSKSEALFRKCYEIADNVLKEAKEEKVVDDHFKGILKDIRTTRISLDEMQKQEAKHLFGDHWNRNFMGKVIIAEDGTSLDSIWQEWAGRYPDQFSADVNPNDQIGELYDIISSLQESSETVVEYDMEERRRWLAHEIFNTFWNLPTVETTADKYEKKLKELKAEHKKAIAKVRDGYKSRMDKQMMADDVHFGRKISELKKSNAEALAEQKKADRERFKQMYANIRERKDAEVALAKEHGREMLEGYKERAEKKTKIQSITSVALTLNDWLVKNNKDKHIVEPLKGPVVELLSAIDFSSKSLIAKGELTKKDVSLVNALRHIEDKLKTMNDGNFTFYDLYGSEISEDITAVIADVENIKGVIGEGTFVLQDMSLQGLKKLDEVVRKMRSAVIKANKFHKVHHSAGIVDLAGDACVEMDKLGGMKYKGELGKTLSNLNWNNLTPYYAFRRYGDSAFKIFEAYMDGYDKIAFGQKAAIDFTKSLYKDEDVRKWEKTVYDFSITQRDGKERKFKMSLPQIMELYCAYKQDDVQEHFQSGITLTEIKKGKQAEIFENIPLEEKHYLEIFSKLNEHPDAKKVADSLHEYMGRVGADLINEISMARWGIKSAGVTNYYPIRVSEGEVDKVGNSKDDKMAIQNDLYSLINAGFTKNRKPGASQSVLIGNIFDTFATHMAEVITYNAMALPVLDALKWYNYRGEDGFGHKFGTQISMLSAFGKGGTKYFEQLISDINGVKKSMSDGIYDTLLRNYKIASVGASLKVALLQPTAYAKAYAMIDAKYLVKGAKLTDLLTRRGSKRAQEHCGAALQKSMGYVDTHMSRGLANEIKHTKSVVEKAREISMKLAEYADDYTFGCLWNACELETKDKHKDLKVGSDEYFKVVSDRMREVIYSTQVMDNTLTRSQIMRNPDGKAKELSMFMSEPTLGYNMVTDAFISYSLDKKRYGKDGAKARHKNRIARVLAGYTLTNALAAAIETAFSALLYGDDEEDENFVWKEFLKNFGMNMSLIGKITYFKDVVSIFEGFDTTRVETQGIVNFFEALGAWKNVIIDGKSSQGLKAVRETIQATSDLLGLPFYKAFQQTTNLFFSYEELKEMFGDFFD